MKVFDNEFWLVSDDNPTLLHGGGGTLDAITLESPSESPISIAGTAGYQVLGAATSTHPGRGSLQRPFRRMRPGTSMSSTTSCSPFQR